jgi:uncharacterized membrane protein YidH (DUF202 family)
MARVSSLPDSTRSPVPNAARRARAARLELLALAIVAFLAFTVFARLDAFERFAAWSRAHDTWQLDEVLVALALSAVVLAIYAARRWRELHAEIVRREAAERATARLEGLLPICAGCKRIRDDAAQWVAVEEYVAARTPVAFTHGICPHCRERLYPGLGD